MVGCDAGSAGDEVQVRGTCEEHSGIFMTTTESGSPVGRWRLDKETQGCKVLVSPGLGAGSLQDARPGALNMALRGLTSPTCQDYQSTRGDSNEHFLC